MVRGVKWRSRTRSLSTVKDLPFIDGTRTPTLLWQAEGCQLKANVIHKSYIRAEMALGQLQGT